MPETHAAQRDQVSRSTSRKPPGHFPDLTASDGPRSSSRVWVLFTLLGALLILALTVMPIADGDTLAFGVVARGILTTGDWLTFTAPWGFLDKPPLTFWMMAVSYRLLGTTDVALRLWQVVLALALVGLTYALARAGGLSREEGLLGALVLETGLLFFYRISEVHQDVALTFFLTLALYALFRYLRGHGAMWSSISAAGLALAALSKGIVAPGFFVLVAGVFLLIARPRLPYSWPRVLGHAVAAGLVFGAICLPWVVAGIQAYGSRFTQTFLLSWSVGLGRLTHQSYPAMPFVLGLVVYLPMFLTAMLPWSGVLTAGLGDLRSLRRALPGIQLAGSWMLVVLAVLSLSRTDRELRYVFPALPAAAILAGRAAAAVSAMPRRAKAAGWASLLVALAVFVPGIVFSLRQYSSATLYVRIAAPSLMLLGAGLLVAAGLFLRGHGRPAIVWLAVTTLLAYSLLEWRGVASASLVNPWAPLATAIKPYTVAAEHVVVYAEAGGWESSADWYLGEAVLKTGRASDVATSWGGGRTLLIARVEKMDELSGLLTPKPVVVYTSGAGLLAVINWPLGVR